MGQLSGMAVSTAACALLLLQAVEAGFPADVKLQTLKLQDPEVKSYGIEIVKATAGVGVGVAILFGIIMTICCLVSCVRCCRMGRRDRAVAEGSFLGDKAFPDADYAYHNIGDQARKHNWSTAVACTALSRRRIHPTATYLHCNLKSRPLRPHYEQQPLTAARARIRYARPARCRRYLWGATLALIIAYVACGAASYSAARKTLNTVDDAYDGTSAFLTDVQLALCSTGSDAKCADGSVGDYVLAVQTTMVGTFAAAVAWIDQLSGVQAPFDAMAMQTGVMSDTQVRARGGPHVRATPDAPQRKGPLSITPLLPPPHARAQATEATLIPDIGTYAGNWTDFFATYARYDFTFAVPNVTADDELRVAADAVTIGATAAATQAANQTTYDIMVSPTSDLMRLSYQLDDVKNNELGGPDLRGAALAATSALSTRIVNASARVYAFQTGPAETAYDTVSRHFSTGVLAVSGIVLLPGLVLLATAACAGLCRTPKPFYLGMAFGYWTQGAFCLVAGLALLLMKLNGDVCKQHKEIIVTNLDVTVPVRGVTSTPLGVGIVGALECTGVYPEAPTATNNLVDIFGIGEAFDMSGPLTDASGTVTGLAPTILSIITSTADITTQLDQLDPYAYTGARAQYVGATATAALDARLAQLPPEPFDRDNVQQAALFETEYLQTANFRWATVTNTLPLYTTALNNLSAMLASVRDASAASYPVDATKCYDPATDAGHALALPLTFAQVAALVDADAATNYYCGAKFKDANNDKAVDGSGYVWYANAGDDDLLW
ncbi:hypothetical protein JKP88DRAFT_243702 [Tribonema minus]|uniref:Uncharacterized protein n=1 Tax=Tribonema minus TaxID=303371 RepID=A0A835ZAU7_9STRA|nr:hypothetical protein JKP88DRAFT_243702 [Tribonema minus]